MDCPWSFIANHVAPHWVYIWGGFQPASARRGEQSVLVSWGCQAYMHARLLNHLICMRDFWMLLYCIILSTCKVPSFGGATKLTARVYIYYSYCGAGVSFRILLSYVCICMVASLHSQLLINLLYPTRWLTVLGMDPSWCTARIVWCSHLYQHLLQTLGHRTSYSVLYVIFVLLLGGINDIHDLGSVAEERTQLV